MVLSIRESVSYIFDYYLIKWSQRLYRKVPYLPGKVLFQPSHVRKIALERLQPLNEYCKQLISLPSNYSRNYYVLKFFQITNDDISFAIEYESNEIKVTNDSLNDSDSNYDEKSMISGPISLKEFYFIADYSVQNSDKEKINFKKNDKVLLVQKYLNGWCWIEHSKQQFCVPYSYIKNSNSWEKESDIVYLEEPELCLVTEDYQAQKYDEISLKKGTKIEITEKNYNGWWKTKDDDGKVGYVPGIYLCPIKSSVRSNLTSSGIQSLSTSLNSLSTSQSPQSISKQSKPTRPPPPKEKFVAVDSFKAFTISGLDVEKGDELILLEKNNDYQWKVQAKNGRTGIVPSFILQRLK